MAKPSVPPITALPDLIGALKIHTRLRRRLRKAYDKLGNQIFAIEHPEAFLQQGNGTHLGAEDQPRTDTQIRTVLTPEIKAKIKAEVELNAPLLDPLREAQEPLAARLKAVDRTVENLAKRLPVYPWVESTRGIGALGLGLIVGEAGDLSNYANPAKLWKRFGLAVMPDGRAQGRVSGRACSALSPIAGMPRTDPELQGFSPSRRAILHTIGAAMVKLKGCEYREIYLKRKAYEVAETPTLTKMHAHRRAMRYMEKRFLRDLWEAWQKTITTMPPMAALSSPDEP